MIPFDLFSVIWNHLSPYEIDLFCSRLPHSQVLKLEATGAIQQAKDAITGYTCRQAFESCLEKLGENTQNYGELMGKYLCHIFGNCAAQGHVRCIRFTDFGYSIHLIYESLTSWKTGHRESRIELPENWPVNTGHNFSDSFLSQIVTVSKNHDDGSFIQRYFMIFVMMSNDDGILENLRARGYSFTKRDLDLAILSRNFRMVSYTLAKILTSSRGYSLSFRIPLLVQTVLRYCGSINEIEIKVQMIQHILAEERNYEGYRSRYSKLTSAKDLAEEFAEEMLKCDAFNMFNHFASVDLPPLIQATSYTTFEIIHDHETLKRYPLCYLMSILRYLSKRTRDIGDNYALMMRKILFIIPESQEKSEMQLWLGQQ